MNSRTEVTLPGKTGRRRRQVWIAGLLTVVLVMSGIFGISAYVGWNLTHPHREALNSDPGALGLAFQNVSFSSRVDKLQMKGWLIPSPGSGKTIIFAHGYRRNRLNSNIPIMAIAREVHNRGYNVLMFDFRNSGESEGNMTSVGQYEVRDLLGAVDFVEAQPLINKEIILYGFSMGASVAILAAARDPEVSAVIADSPFADLKTYMEKNLSVWSGLPSIPFNQAFFLVVPLLTGINPDAVSPVGEINKLAGRPLLLIHGESDADVPIENSEMLQKSYPQSQLLRVPGGTHVQNYAANPQLYIATLAAFLQIVQPVAKR